MARTVRCGLIQTRNVHGPDRDLETIKKAMIDRHVTLIGEAARKKVKILCLQELFYGPYFCAEQEPRWYHLTEHVPDGPTTTLIRKLAKKHRMVIVAPIYEEDSRGSTTTPPRSSTRMGRTSGNIARPTSRTASQASGRSSIFVPATLAIPSSRRLTRRSESTSATTGTFRKVLARLA